MAKTIQVRVDYNLKASADMLFASLGLDTSTAIRMFLTASMESGGIPFRVGHKADRGAAIMEAIKHREAGGAFYTTDEFLAHMREAIAEGAGYADR
jgi:DNA-damage-inducible protein J